MTYIKMIEKVSAFQPLVLTLDELKHDQKNFIFKITHFLDIPNSSKPIKNKIINSAFSKKQLQILRKFNKFYRYNELKSSSRFFNKVHYKYREFLLHIIAFLSKFIPSFFIKKEELVPTEKLKDIQIFYKKDWSKIKSYVKAPSPSPS